MFGKNPKRPAINGDGHILAIQEIFATFQGEGPFAGWPAVFIRLGGCNLACDFCDTEFESFYDKPLENILQTVQALAGNVRKLVVITGGEPFRQPITPLCEALLAAGFNVQIETNGTLYRPVPDAVSIVCSPKNQGSGYHSIRKDLLQRVNAFKFIISATHPGYQDVAEVGQSTFNIPVYVQPMDEYNAEKNQKNLHYTVELALKQGYRFSLQTHKIAGVA